MRTRVRTWVQIARDLFDLTTGKKGEMRDRRRDGKSETTIGAIMCIVVSICILNGGI